jgi:hypothetical protein
MRSIEMVDGKFSGIRVEDRIDPLTSAYVLLRSVPTELHFGQFGGENFKVRISADGRSLLPI